MNTGIKMKRDKTRRSTLIDLDLTVEQREILKEHFSSIDRLNSGTIEQSDIKKLLTDLGENVNDSLLSQVKKMIDEKNL